MLKNEEWKKLNFDKNYLVSSFGRVYSIKSDIFLSPFLHKSRSAFYLRISIKGKKKMVHVLVAEHFHSRKFKYLQKKYPNEKLQVDHLDGNTLNPNMNNTEWVTESENKKRSWKKRRSPGSSK